MAGKSRAYLTVVDDQEVLVPRKKTRSTRNGGVKPEIKEKFLEERNNPPPVVAKTAKQKEYFRLLEDPEVKAIVCLGLHGTGKTFCAAVVAADKFRKNEIKQIIVARAYVQTGKTSGYKPGTSLMKLYPYVRNVLDTIKSRIGAGAYEIALKDGESGEIQVQEVESIRGRSFDLPSYLIIDESQQTTKEEMQSIVTRVSDNCKLVLCGDILQKDIQGESGLEWFMSFSKRHNLKGVAVIDFNSPDEIVRGGLVKDIAIGMMKDREKENK
jgi:phosphate starvation-inducible protein PhoH and related proteins